MTLERDPKQFGRSRVSGTRSWSYLDGERSGREHVGHPSLDEQWPGPGAVPMARPDTATVPLEESVALYDEVGHALIMLNASAAAVWGRCDGVSSFEEIVTNLAEAHAVSTEAIRHDVWQTLHKLGSIGLISDTL